MIILCCPVNLYPATRESLSRFAPDTKIADIHDYIDDVRYPWEIYKSYWGQDDLVIIEQDIILHEDVIPQFESCPEPWCVFPFRHAMGGEGFVTTGIGCNRFRREFQEKVTVELIESMPASCHRCKGTIPGCWAHLDGTTREAGEEMGFNIHVHRPSVGHRNNPPGEYPS